MSAHRRAVPDDPDGLSDLSPECVVKYRPAFRRTSKQVRVTVLRLNQPPGCIRLTGIVHCARHRRRCVDASPKRKRTNFRWPSVGINSPANRPDPDGPEGLGAEESGTERTGSTQDCFVASHGGKRWAEVGQQYDSSNVPVTRCVHGIPQPVAALIVIQWASCSARRLAQSCHGWPDPEKWGSVFGSKIKPEMTGGAR
jgi:hypothetical protein